MAALGFSQAGFMYPVILSSEDAHLAPGSIVVPRFDLTETPAFVNAVWQTVGLSSPVKETSLEHEIRIRFNSIEEIPTNEFWAFQSPESPTLEADDHEHLNTTL
jgi:hypothetical protein